MLLEMLFLHCNQGVLAHCQWMLSNIMLLAWLKAHQWKVYFHHQRTYGFYIGSMVEEQRLESRLL
eukprot:2966992-Ditylum_brightwellii.AAC.1